MEQHFGKIPEVPFREVFVRYAKIQKRDNPQRFRNTTRYALKMLHEWFGELNVSQITLGLVQEFMDERRRTVSLATAQRDVSTLRAVLNKAHREGLLAAAPRFPKFKALKHRTRWLTPNEEERLVRAASRHIVPLIRLAVDTGGRLSELLNLDWRSVDLRNRRVTFLKTKNGEDRPVRLCDRACAVLSSLGPKSDGPVFTFRGKPIKSVRTAFEKARQKAGLEDVRFHDLRHTFASRLVQGGVPLYDVKHLMGHKSLEMVQRYAHLAPDYQERAIGVLNRFGHNLGTVDGDGCALPGENPYGIKPSPTGAAVAQG